MILTIIIFVITLLILVVSHEFGHFAAAKKFGVKVLEFGFGLPPRLLGKKKGDTIYSLNALPIGGFVRLYGEDESDSKILKDKDSFASKSVLQRAVIVVAGVVMNLLLAWLMFYIVLAAQGFTIIYPTASPVVQITDVEPNSPAYKAGIKQGEIIDSINGVSVQGDMNNPDTGIDQVKNLISGHTNQSITMDLSDVSKTYTREVTVRPEKLDSGSPRIGVGLSPVSFKEYKTLPEKMFSGISYSFDLTKLTYQGLGTLFSDISHKDLSKASDQVAGPVGMVVIANNILSIGLQAVLPYLWFVGVISLTLAIMNILPFPALDGGRLLFILIEAVFGRKVSPELESYIHTVGMAILMLLILLVTYSDLRKFVF